MTKLSKEKCNQFITQVHETDRDDAKLFNFLPFPSETLPKCYQSAYDYEKIVADQHNEINQNKRQICELEELQNPYKTARHKFVKHIIDLYKIPNENENFITQSTFRISKEANSENDLIELFNIFLVESKYGNLTSINNLGFCYQHGQGVKQTLEEAVRLYQIASDGDNLDAIFSLGLCYENGDGVEKNHEEATRLFQIASDGGNLDTRTKLANLCPT